MRRSFKILAIATCGLLLAAGGFASWLYRASHAVPLFYLEAVERSPEEQTTARDEFVAEAATLAGDLHRSGGWQSSFTAAQINAWLALDLPTQYPSLLRKELREPRIEIGDQEATIACRYESGGLSMVLSLTVEVYLHESDVLALRICHVRAGAIPMPLGQVLDAISRVARDLRLQLEWRKTHGDPVAIIALHSINDSPSALLQLKTIELRDGELFIAGFNGPIAPASQATSETVPQPRVGSAAKETVQE